METIIPFMSNAWGNKWLFYGNSRFSTSLLATSYGTPAGGKAQATRTLKQSTCCLQYVLLYKTLRLQASGDVVLLKM